MFSITPNLTATNQETQCWHPSRTLLSSTWVIDTLLVFIVCVCVFLNVHRCRHNCPTKHTEGKDSLNGIGDHVVISPGGGICVRVRRDGRNGSAVLSGSLWSGGLWSLSIWCHCVSPIFLYLTMPPESAFLRVLRSRHSAQCYKKDWVVCHKR